MVHPPRFERGTLSSEVLSTAPDLTLQNQTVKPQIEETVKGEISPELAGTFSIFPEVPLTPRYANATQSESAVIESSDATSNDESILSSNLNQIEEGEGGK
jgi:hypothetical protein